MPDAGCNTSGSVIRYFEVAGPGCGTTRRPTSAAAAKAKASTATRGRGRPPKAATRKSAGREPNAPSLAERVLALATGKTRQELYLACPNDRPNHIGIAVQRHLRAGPIQERDGKLYATSSAAPMIA